MLRKKLLKYFVKLKNSNNLAKQQRYKFKLNLYKQLAGAASVCICDMKPGLECSHCSQTGTPPPFKALEQSSKEEDDEPASASAAVSSAHSASKIGKTSAVSSGSHEPQKKPVEKLNFSLKKDLDDIFDEQNLLGYMHGFISESVNQEFSCKLHPEKCIYYKEFKAYRNTRAYRNLARAKRMKLRYNHVMDPAEWEYYYDNPDSIKFDKVTPHSDKFNIDSYFEHFDNPGSHRYISFHRDHTECFKNTFLQHRQYSYKIEGIRIQSYVNLKEICEYYLSQKLDVFNELNELHIGVESHITSMPDTFPFVFPKLETLEIEIGIETLPETFSSFKMLKRLSIGFPMDISKVPIMNTVEFLEYIRYHHTDFEDRRSIKSPENTIPVLLKTQFPLLYKFTEKNIHL